MKPYIMLIFIMYTNWLSAATLSVIKTGDISATEAMLMQGGSYFSQRELHHSAILINHQNRYVLFDTGLGENIETQFELEMPFWLAPFFKFNKGQSAYATLFGAVPVSHIYLSHIHWDHAGGVQDFKSSQLMLSNAQLATLQHEDEVSTFSSQFESVHAQTFTWTHEPYLEFNKYYDIFADNRFVLVPLAGHTHGSVGLLAHLASGNYFFVGDTLWLAEQLDSLSHKAWPAASIVDQDKRQLEKSFAKLKVMRDMHNYTLIPAHDARALGQLAHYPNWQK